MIKLGDRSTKVRMTQELLKALGYDPGIVDGIYGARTAGAVALFQSENNLSATGVVDDKTAYSLSELFHSGTYKRPLSPTAVTKVGPTPTTPLVRTAPIGEKAFLGLPVKYWMLGSVIFAGITLMLRRK